MDDESESQIGVHSILSKNGGPKYNLEKLLNSRSSRSNSTSNTSFTVVAITEGRGPDRGIIGMSSMDLRDPSLTICEFFDSTSYTKLKTRLFIIDPLEILIPEAVNDKQNHMKVLVDVIKSCVSKGTSITCLQRRFFNDAKGIELVKQIGAPECCNIDTSVVKKYYCMSAAAALIKYIEFVQNILFHQKSLKIIYEAIDESCLIDVNSWGNLDLIDVDKKAQKDDQKTLFSLLNKCLTGAGSRLLRSCLLQPSSDVNFIEERLDVVQEFILNPAMLERLRSLLMNTNDCQFLITLCICKNMNIITTNEESLRSIRIKILQILNLKKLIMVAFAVREVLSSAKSSWLIRKRDKLADPRLAMICEIIDEKIDEAVFLRKSSGSSKSKDAALFAVKEGLHVLLDLARKAYTELTNDIAQLATEEGEKVPGSSITYSFSRGYHFSLTSKDPLSVHLPPHCIQIVRHRASLTYTTRDLIKYNDRLNQSESEVLFKSNIIIDQAISEIRHMLPALHHVVEILTHLDLLTALGIYSAITKCVRPSFDNEIIIRHGRHPILDSEGEVVPNDTYIIPSSRFVIITGPNMAGKSTYMKQICLLQILAQLGCFVPAEFASFAPMERIFSRVGHNDDITRNLSAFALEMAEISIILPNANEKSLIVIDELARSTSTEEGIGICYAICEKLIRSRAFVLFATHFLDLSLLELSFSAVQNFHFSVQTTRDKDGNEVLHPAHKLYKGTYKGPLYGFELAELTTFPPSLLKRARETAEKLRSDVQIHRLSKIDESIAHKRKLAYIAHRIQHVMALVTEDNKESVATYLIQLRQRILDQSII
ncbi:hypothetical protein FO519_008399 [Halicephalobus sp. NKZ332]|nr:hypothetical protein FO519_008399 [Halicephalobus sp. NKZ332]